MNPRPDLCDQVGVRRFPTWVLGGKRFEGVMTLDQIAQASGFAPPSAGAR